MILKDLKQSTDTGSCFGSFFLYILFPLRSDKIMLKWAKRQSLGEWI